MEYLKNKFCAGFPYFCSAGTQATELKVKTEIELPSQTRASQMVNTKQKPWSVFGEVYWI